jgi:hypothetical protein
VVQQWKGFPDSPSFVPTVFESKHAKRVRFSPSKSNDIIAPSDLSEEEVKGMWLSRQELKEFKKSARLNVIGFRIENGLYLKDFPVLFQACSSKESNHIQSLLRTESAQRYLETIASSSIRGLEGFSHPIVRQHRTSHVQKLLVVQAKATACAELRETVCRVVSMNSSRASRVFGRLLGHGDAIEVARIILEELKN